MKINLRYLTVAATALLFASDVSAQQVLNFVSPTNPRSHTNREFFPPWIKAVNKEAGGAIKVVPNYGGKLANPRNIWERLRADVLQIGWGIVTMRAKQFPRSTVSALPVGVNSAERVAVANWRLYEKRITKPEFEKAGVMILTMAGFPQSTIHSNKPLKSLGDLKGMKMATSSRVAATLLKSLGAQPLTFPLPMMYMQLQKKVVDGIYMQWTAFQPFRLYEVTKYHLDGGFGSATGAIFMMKKRFDGLPSAAKKALLKHSGEAHSRSFGQHWDKWGGRGRQMTAKKGGHIIGRLSAADEAKLAKSAQALIKGWVKRIPDGPKVLNAFKAELAAQK